MPPTTTTAPAVTQSPENTMKPTRDEVIGRIIAECKSRGIPCSRGRADGLMQMLQSIAAKVGTTKQPYFFRPRQITRYHHILEAVMPDNFVRNGLDIKPGSAYAGINALCLGPNQLTFEHTRTERDGHVYCTTMVYIRVL